MVSEDMRSCVVRVHRYDNKNLEGVIYNLYYGIEIPFDNLTRLLLLMDDMMDEIDCPQASIKSKRFVKMNKQPERDSIPNTLSNLKQDVLATFKVKVLFRQGASWQGKVEWVEEGMETSFRSALELVKLMDSALPQPQMCTLAYMDEAEAM